VAVGTPKTPHHRAIEAMADQVITIEVLISSLEQFIYQQVLPLKNEKTAIACAYALTQCLYLNFRGQLIYVPTSDGVDKAKEYQAIYADFNYHNHQELAVKYRRSLANIYAIVKQMQRAELRKHQTDLFSTMVAEDKKDRPITLSVIHEYLPHEFVKLGLNEEEAAQLAEKIASKLCQLFPGVLVFVSKNLIKKRQSPGQTDLF
jgi:Mor family transcriptional regulator